MNKKHIVLFEIMLQYLSHFQVVWMYTSYIDRLDVYICYIYVSNIEQSRILPILLLISLTIECCNRRCRTIDVFKCMYVRMCIYLCEGVCEGVCERVSA